MEAPATWSRWKCQQQLFARPFPNRHRGIGRRKMASASSMLAHGRKLRLLSLAVYFRSLGRRVWKDQNCTVTFRQHSPQQRNRTSDRSSRARDKSQLDSLAVQNLRRCISAIKFSISRRKKRKRVGVEEARGRLQDDTVPVKILSSQSDHVFSMTVRKKSVSVG